MAYIPASLVSKGKGFIVKILPFLRKCLKKKYWIYRTAKNLDLAETENNDISIYYSALYTLENDELTHPDMIRLFCWKSIRKTFIENVRSKNGNIDNVVADIRATLHAVPRFSFIRDSQVDWEITVSKLWAFFESKVYEVADPVQAIAFKKMDTLTSGVQTRETSLDLSGMIDNYAELRKANQHLALLGLLNHFKDENWEQLPRQDRYRLTLNIAITYHELYEKEKAAEYFIELLDFGVFPADTAGYAALAYATVRNKEKALSFARQSLEINPANINAYLARLFAEHPHPTAEQVLSSVPTDYQADPSIQMNLAIALQREGRYDDALKIFLALVAGHPQKDAFRAELLNSISANYTRSLGMDELSPPYVISSSDREILLEAKQKLTEAWDFIGSSGLAASRSYMIGNRGGINMVLGYYKEALRDLDNSLSLRPSFTALSNLWLLYETEPQKRMDLFEEMNNTTLSEVDRAQLLAFKTGASKEPAAIEKIMEETNLFFETAENTEARRLAMDCLVEQHVGLGRLSEAEDLTDQYIKEWPGSPMGYFFKAKLALNRGDTTIANEWAHQALHHLGDKTSGLLKGRIMQMLNWLGDHVTVIAALQSQPVERFTPSLSELLTAYFESGDYQNAFRLADHWRLSYPDNPLFVDLIGSIYANEGNHPRAESTYLAYLEGHPGEVLIRLKLGATYYAALDFNAAAEAFDEAGHFEKLPLAMRFQVADAFCKAGEKDKGMELAYQLRATNFQELEAHENYIRVLNPLYLGQTKRIDPEIAGEGVAVKVRSELNKDLTFVLVKTPVLKEETSLDTPVAKALVGKKLGETITVAKESYSIIALLSKFTFAFQDSMEQLQTRFANQGQFKIGHIKPGANPVETIQQMLSMMGESTGEEQRKTIIDAPPMPPPTFAVKAYQTGSSVIDYWYQMTAPNSVGLWAYSDFWEVKLALNILGETSESLLIDITSLLTFQKIGALAALAECGKHLCVGGSTVHMIKEELYEYRKNEKMALATAAALGRSAAENGLQERIQELGSLLAWIQEHTTIIFPPLSTDFHESVRLSNVVGKTYSDIFRLAEARQYMVVSEDIVFRVACREQNIHTGHAIVLLQHFCVTGLIAQDRLQHLFMHLIRLHYLFVPLNAVMLMELLREATYAVSFPFKDACELINPHFLDDRNASYIVVHFLYLLYQEQPLATTRSLVTQYILAKLFFGRKRFEVLRAFSPLLEERFLLLQPQKTEILEHVHST